jgi:hypothetical protein
MRTQQHAVPAAREPLAPAAMDAGNTGQAYKETNLSARPGECSLMQLCIGAQHSTMRTVPFVHPLFLADTKSETGSNLDRTWSAMVTWLCSY